MSTKTASQKSRTTAELGLSGEPEAFELEMAPGLPADDDRTRGSGHRPVRPSRASVFPGSVGRGAMPMSWRGCWFHETAEASATQHRPRRDFPYRRQAATLDPPNSVAAPPLLKKSDHATWLLLPAPSSKRPPAFMAARAAKQPSRGRAPDDC